MDRKTRKRALDLFLTFEFGGHDFFTAELYRLIAKADGINRLKLMTVYPVEVGLYVEWMETEHPKDFYRKYELTDLLYGPEKETCARMCKE
jgi:hypothetical protein